MFIHSEHTSSKKTAIADAVAPKSDGSKLNSQIIDNRPTAIAQRKLQAVADNRQQVDKPDKREEKAPLQSPSIPLQLSQGFYTSSTAIIQRELAVQVIKKNDFKNLVKDISIQGRPEGVLQNEEGSHTTAWVVSTEGVRNAVVGKPFESAVAGMEVLINFAYKMPGIKRVENQTSNKVLHFEESRKNLEIAKKMAFSTPNLLSLQGLIEAYLIFRNAIPLSSVKLGATADGKGESKWIKVLYDWENQSPAILEEALLSLIDFDAILGFEKASAAWKHIFLDAPGVTAEDKKSDAVKQEIIEQHLLSVQGSFPEAYEKSGLSALKTPAIYKKIGSYDMLHKQQKEEGKKVVYPVSKKNPSKRKTAVQIDMGPKFDFLMEFETRKIQSIKIAGRPRGVFGSGEKSHTTAWSVIEQGPKTACLSKTLPKAFEAMKVLCRKALSLPQSEMSDALPVQQKKEFDLADKTLASDVKSENFTVDGLQKMIVDYLNLKNLMPFSAVDLGKKADSHGEPEKLDKLRNPNLYSKSVLQTAIWGLLDREALVDIGVGAVTQKLLVKTKAKVYEELFEQASIKMQSSGKRSSRGSQEFKDLPKYEEVEPEYAFVFENATATHKRLPGVPHPTEYAEGEMISDKVRRVAMVVENHLQNIEISFPDAFAKAAITKEDIKTYVAYKLGIDKPGFEAIANEFIK